MPWNVTLLEVNCSAQPKTDSTCTFTTEEGIWIVRLVRPSVEDAHIWSRVKVSVVSIPMCAFLGESVRLAEAVVTVARKAARNIARGDIVRS